MDDPGELERQELAATLEARRELGPAYEPALVDSFVDKVETAIEARVDARLAEREKDRQREDDKAGQQFKLGIASLALGIPISGAAGGIADLPGLVVAWAGIVGVNCAYAWQNRRRG